MTLLAHAGPGSTWQAMVVVAAVALAVAVVLAVAGVLRLRRADDLVVPLAGAAILASTGPLASGLLSDQIGWALPLGAVALAGLLLAALTPLELATDGVLTYVVAGLAVAGALVLQQPLSLALHPPPDLLPTRDDATVEIVAPSAGAAVSSGPTEVEVAVEGATLVDGLLPADEVPDDPEEQAFLAASLSGEQVDTGRLDIEVEEDCPPSDPCERVTFPVELPPGQVRLRVELTRGDGVPFAPTNADAVELDVQGAD